MTTRIALLFSLTVAAFGVAAGQGPLPTSPNRGAASSANVTLTEGQLLKPAPEFSHWVVDFVYPQDRDAAKRGTRVVIPPELPRRIVTTKTKDVIHEETLTVAGKQLDAWQQAGNFYIKYPGQNFWSAYEKPDQGQLASGRAVAMAVPENGFRNLDWLNRESYVGPLKQRNTVYLVFLPPGTAKPDLTKPETLDALPTVAYVDEKSRLPVLVRKDLITQTYTFMATPSAMQAFPSALTKEIQEGKEKRALAIPAPHAE